jgi:hypothetical protein
MAAGEKNKTCPEAVTVRPVSIAEAAEDAEDEEEAVIGVTLVCAPRKA